MLSPQRCLDDPFEFLEGLCTGKKPVVDEESRHTLHPERFAPLKLCLDLGGCLSRFQAGDKGISVEAQVGGVFLELFGQVLLPAPFLGCLEETLVHGPEGFGSLLGGAERSLGCWSSLRVDGVQRVLKENVFDLACGDVRFIQKRSRL